MGAGPLLQGRRARARVPRQRARQPRRPAARVGPARGAAARAVLVREETLRDSRNVGIARSWYPTGQLRRVASYGDDEREQASAEFTPQGQLADLRCATKPALGSDFDDRAACGFAGGASNVTLYGGKGVAKARVSYERGERKKSETLWESGAVRELSEIGPPRRRRALVRRRRHQAPRAAVDDDRRRAAAPGDRPRPGIPRKRQAAARAPLAADRARRRAGRRSELVPERPAEDAQRLQRRRRPDAAPRDRLPRQRPEVVRGQRGSSAPAGGRGEARPVGTQQSFDAEGRLRSERIYDERGRIKRERELDERGNVVRDDEVFEDGSRKAVGR